MPAARATLARARGLFVSLIEEARADQKEGRLGTELLRIRQLFERTQPGSLIILDELCSDTNPSEGEDIIRLVLSLLGELGASVLITTHFLQFARRLSEEQSEGRLSFLQVELDEHERRPIASGPVWPRPRSRIRPRAGSGSRVTSCSR